MSHSKVNLPTVPGIYAFWWIGPRCKLLSANRLMRLKGPNGKDVSVELKDWWPSDLPFPCLYIGKTTNLKKRFSLHLKSGSAKRLHTIGDSNRKAKLVTTSCQLRYGIEHVFKTEKDPLGIIKENVGFSFQTEGVADNVIGRFYTEDLLIGKWRPWFNIDSER